MTTPIKKVRTVIFSAPAGWGKTKSADELRRVYGCESVVDGWSPESDITPGALHLTNAEPMSIPRSLIYEGVSIVSRGWNPPLFAKRSIHG